VITDGSEPKITSLEHERLIRRGDEAAKSRAKHFGEMRMLIYTMVRGLAAAKRMYANNQAFDGWLRNSEFWEINPADRAALIELCEYPLHELLQFLGKTSLIEPYQILDALKRKGQI